MKKKLKKEKQKPPQRHKQETSLKSTDFPPAKTSKRGKKNK